MLPAARAPAAVPGTLDETDNRAFQGWEAGPRGGLLPEGVYSQQQHTPTAAHYQ